ncbi:Ribokinase-like protein [Lipomyces oligophaga]|uniref:Ribokinase-like protein n=1 Tax=Lipomyces oligophaga TaxID=45792 RepID=UPI0034CE5710
MTKRVADFDKKILAISSHVVHGYVGNRASTLPLQLLGWDVDVLNTVSFSNHTGYTQWTGERATAEQIRTMVEGLRMNTLADGYDAVLTGYIPGAEAVCELGRVVSLLREDAGRDVVWVLDPVMGDEDKLYVAPEVIPAYESIISLATVITPNQFEAELLSSPSTTIPSERKPIKTEQDVFNALHAIYEKYKTPNIVISSAVLDESDAPAEFICAGQTIRKDGTRCQFLLRLPFIDAYFTGTGDLFGALVADRFCRRHYQALQTQDQEADATVADEDLPFVRAVEEASAAVQAVLRNTADAVAAYDKTEDTKAQITGVARPAKGTKERRIMDMKNGELRLIQSQAEILSEPVKVRAIMNVI